MQGLPQGAKLFGEVERLPADVMWAELTSIGAEKFSSRNLELEEFEEFPADKPLKQVAPEKASKPAKKVVEFVEPPA